MHDPNPLAHLWAWIEVHVGAQNEAGSYYGFWSGFGRDLSEITLVAALIAELRHINCHTKRCWRIGKHPVEGTPYRVCAKCHPTVPDGGATKDHIHRAHKDRTTR